jgi:hypothetical protein
VFTSLLQNTDKNVFTSLLQIQIEMCLHHYYKIQITFLSVFCSNVSTFLSVFCSNDVNTFLSVFCSNDVNTFLSVLETHTVKFRDLHQTPGT